MYQFNSNLFFNIEWNIVMHMRKCILLTVLELKFIK